MIAALRSELILLNRRRLWVMLAVSTIVFTVPATWLIVATAEPAGFELEEGITLEAIAGPGGATAAVVSAIAFSAVLVLAAFVSSTAGDLSRGSLRVAFTRSPRRLSLLSGKVLARMVVAVGVMVLALVVGWTTAMLVAPGSDIDTADWVGWSALGQAADDLGRLIGFVFVYAVLGTTVAVLTRSTPVALGVSLAWFGPIENVIAENLSFAQRWFPGLLLRSLLRPDGPSAVSTGAALATLGAYLAVALAVTGAVIARRDVTT